MANPFTTLRNAMVRSVQTVMAHDATWTPSAGGTTLTARVYFNEPTEADRLRELEYGPVLPHIQFHVGSFPGLYEAQRSGAVEEIRVVGRKFVVNEVRKHFDGDTYIAKLEEIA